MKRIISIIICVLLVFSCFAGCKQDENKDVSSKIDIEYYAKLGQMPECEFALGADVDEVNNTAKKVFEESDEAYYSLVEGEKSILIDAGAFRYYYEKEKADEGVSLLVNYNTAYGFELGAVSIEIEEALSDFKAEITTDMGELFFMNNIEGELIGKKYTFGSNEVIFVFSNNALVATAIYSLENWTL